VEQMIEKGKQWYLLDHFMPLTDDSLKTGYTRRQVEWCQSNEGMIWNYLTQSNDMFTTDPSAIQVYIGESPKTDAPGVPDAAPGNLGQWIGWQIVKTFAAKNSSLTLQQVLATPARKIFEEAKYKPH
jgi:uncharacterized protein YjaZ